MTVCNACRYCEAYCPVFQAMEDRTSFAKGDLAYLANVCHNCGECLYACQYAPPHEFGINVPRSLAQIRVASYEEFCWPRFMSRIFQTSSVFASVALSLACVGILSLFVRTRDARSEFYAVIPHDVMVGIFGITGSFVVVAMTIGVVRAMRSFEFADSSGPPKGGHNLSGLRDALTLRHLHATGENCTSDIEVRTPWRRYFHHCTFYGFALCLASTTVAAVYHTFFAWLAPYAYLSVPVALGTVGGVGLVAGPVGLLWQYRQRDPNLTDPAQRGLDLSFIVMLLATSVTGLLLLTFRSTRIMSGLLVIHLGFVLGLFLTMPYGKFVHGIYRTVALLKFAAERPA